MLILKIQRSDEVTGMKSIEERAKEFAQNFEIIPKNMDCEGCDTCTKCKTYRRYVDIVTEQKNIDDAILLKLKSAWEKQAQINHDDELNYQQGYHDAIEKACKACKNELQRLKTQLDESVGVAANLMSVDKSLSRIAKEMLYEDD